MIRTNSLLEKGQFVHNVCHCLLASSAFGEQQQHCLQASSGTSWVNYPFFNGLPDDPGLGQFG